jgi:hypothetical protein
MHISRQKSITSRSIKKTGALIVIRQGFFLKLEISLNYRGFVPEQRKNGPFQKAIFSLK